jgi:hypothetical protein
VVSLIFYQQHKQEEGKEKKNNKTEMWEDCRLWAKGGDLLNCRIALCSEKREKREIKYLRGVAGFTSLYWLTCQVQRKHGTIYDSVHQVYTKDFH